MQIRLAMLTRVRVIGKPRVIEDVQALRGQAGIPVRCARVVFLEIEFRDLLVFILELRCLNRGRTVNRNGDFVSAIYTVAALIIGAVISLIILNEIDEATRQ